MKTNWKVSVLLLEAGGDDEPQAFGVARANTAQLWSDSVKVVPFRK